MRPITKPTLDDNFIFAPFSPEIETGFPAELEIMPPWVIALGRGSVERD
jgi:hypothetical protein